MVSDCDPNCVSTVLWKYGSRFQKEKRQVEEGEQTGEGMLMKT